MAVRSVSRGHYLPLSNNKHKAAAALSLTFASLSVCIFLHQQLLFCKIMSARQDSEDRQQPEASTSTRSDDVLPRRFVGRKSTAARTQDGSLVPSSVQAPARFVRQQVGTPLIKQRPLSTMVTIVLNCDFTKDRVCKQKRSHACDGPCRCLTRSCTMKP